VNNKLNTEKEIVAKYLYKINKLDRLAIVAGGCPRDWMLDRFANDIDVYVQLPGVKLDLVRILFDSVFGKANRNGYNTTYYPDSSNYIKYFLSYCVEGKVFQIIVLKDNYYRYNLLTDFKISSSQILAHLVVNTGECRMGNAMIYTKEAVLQIVYYEDFREFLENKVIHYSQDKYKFTKYIDKIKLRFSKDCTFANKDNFILKGYYSVPTLTITYSKEVI